jgi:hypothetical protein
MFKITSLIKKTALSALIMAIGLAALPLTGASASGVNDQSNLQPDNSRLERVWVREQRIYQRAGNRLAKAGDFITNVQALIERANAMGWDTTSIQAALNALSGVIPAAKTAHAPGAAIINGHAGFDANGKVVDRTTAIATVKSLAQVLKDTQTAMNGTGKALLQAINAFREAHHRPTITPLPQNPS